MLDQFPIIVQPSIRPHHPPCEEYCTVVFRLQGGRSAMDWFLAELSQHFEGSGLPRSSSSRSVTICVIGVN